MNHQHEPENQDQDSVWDYFIEKIKFWTHDPVEKEKIETPGPITNKPAFPWLSLVSLILGLMAQLTFEPSPGRTPWPGIILYLAAGGCLLASILRREWRLPDLIPDQDEPMSTAFRLDFFLIGLLLAILAFVLFDNGRFGLLNTFLWLLSIVFIFLSFGKMIKKEGQARKEILSWIKAENWRICISRWTIIVLGVIAIILFFNFYRLDSVPPEMVSDQAEKLLDINDILNGSRAVYFPRNTGREPIHFYLTALFMAVFNLEVSFLNLKIVAVFANLLTLFFIYLLGKEIGNKWVGLGAALFAGMAYWPLLFTRLALRIPYYPLFVAPVMYFMIRGLRRQDVMDILLTGLFLGLGLYGYTPFRIVPIFVVLGTIIYLVHKPAENKRLQAIFALALITLVSLVVFVPLLRYWLANPDLFAYRAFSRLTGMEAGFQKAPALIFLENFWKASIMFFWDNGVIWAHSIPGRPALEIVSGALYFSGIIGLLVRYIRKRRWVDLFLLVSIPMMMMPSILSLAYPGENPSLNRTAGAVVPVFVVIGLSLETFIRTFRARFSGLLAKFAPAAILGILVLWSGLNNYDLVFNQYYQIYRASSWNTSEIGDAARFFIESIGSPETTYLVGYPHWVDSRLVAINAGQAGRDFAIFPEQIPATQNDPRAKMFFVNMYDTENIELLAETYPWGALWKHDSDVENKDFMIFFVPPMQGTGANDN
ncbi:MAG: glycosyltransferase family 39 protein [Brevefilum sp.]|nr:glycosyltransferase family 39 protein [Brevefilum sp.]